MPDHAWKISLMLGMLAGSILICLFGQFKFGPDLAGGITLIYELSDAPQAVDNWVVAEAISPNAAKQIKSGGREFSMSKLIGALKSALTPTEQRKSQFASTVRQWKSSFRKSARTRWISSKQKITKRWASWNSASRPIPSMTKDKFEHRIGEAAAHPRKRT